MGASKKQAQNDRTRQFGRPFEIAQLCRARYDHAGINPEIDSGPRGLSFRWTGIGSETGPHLVMLHKVYDLLRCVSARGRLAGGRRRDGGGKGCYPNGGNRGQRLCG